MKKSARDGEKKRWTLSTSAKWFLIALGVLLLAMIVLSVLARCGLTLIQSATMLYLPALAVVVLLAWGAFILFRRMKTRASRIIVGAALSLVLMLVLSVGASYLGLIASVGYPQKYALLASPSGARSVVVLRTLDVEEERVNARMRERLAADPEGSPEVTVDDMGYAYAVYPRVLGVFFRSSADVEGLVHIGYSSQARLMQEWADDESSLRLYIEDPGVGDEGECVLTFAGKGQ